MPGWAAMVPAADPLPGPRLALVVATGTYTADLGLRRLRAPARDADDLAQVLADPGIGGFAVTTVIDQPAQQVRLAIEDFLHDRGTGDLLLVYLSCHGLLDARRRLYFAATDTRKDRLGSTGIESAWVLDQLEHCRARRQVLILDSCFSGAFAHGAKGEAELGLRGRFLGQGRGRVVLTASTATEYSFEGDPTDAATPVGSVFTAALVQGLRTGAADTDHDGHVSVDDAYAYVFDHVRAVGAAQTPQRWLYGAEGRILLARNPAGPTVIPAPLPESLRAGLESPHPGIRIGAVNELGGWLTGDDPARVATALRHLQEVAETDTPRVAAAARSLLGAYRSNPEALARTEGIVAQLRTIIAQLEEQLARARDRGDARTERSVEEALTARRAWLEEAEHALGKFTQENPWQQFARTHQIGQVVSGRVIKVWGSGALVRIEKDVVGLVHRSELADQHVEPAAVVQVGAMIIVRIIGINLDQRRISLSLKQANKGTQDMTAYAAQSITSPSASRRVPARTGVNEASFLAALDNDAYRQALSDIFDSCQALGLTFEWGTKGSSIRLATLDRPEPLSVGWIFPSVPGWSGLTHLTLGYDSSSARHTPSVISALDSYLEQLSQIAGAKAVTAKALKAYTWTPPQVTNAKTQLIEALEALVAAASSAEPDQPAPAGPPAPAIAHTISPVPSQPTPRPALAQVPPSHLARILTGHTDRIVRVAFSPDGLLLATAGSDRTARVWDPATGEHLQTLTGHNHTVNGVAFSPDGALLATASSDGTARLWDPATGQHLHTLTSDSYSVSGVAFSPDGRLLATASGHGAARLWDPATGEHLRALTNHDGPIWGVAFSPDGRLLATACSDRTAQVWDPATGQHLRTLTGHTGMVSGVAFSPDGRLLASGGADKAVRLWDPATGQHLRTLTGHTGTVSGVAFSPDGALLATASSDGTARLWDLREPPGIRPVENRTLSRAAPSRDVLTWEDSSATMSSTSPRDH